MKQTKKEIIDLNLNSNNIFKGMLISAFLQRSCVQNKVILA